MKLNYINALNYVLEQGILEKNNRTGVCTKRVFGLNLVLNTSDYIFSSRKLSPKIAAAEVAWMLMGTCSTAWINRYTKIWKQFENPENYIETAYGYRWLYLFARNQIKEALQLLNKDSSTRQALVMSWDPYEDGLMNQGKQKNVPCPFAFSFYIREGKGYLIVYQRSADMVVGIPYDLMTYFLLGQAMFNSLDKKVVFEEVQFLIGDAHIYENHLDIADVIINNPPPFEHHKLDHPYTLDEIQLFPDKFVDDISEQWNDIKFAIDTKLEAIQ